MIKNARTTYGESPDEYLQVCKQAWLLLKDRFSNNEWVAAWAPNIPDERGITKTSDVHLVCLVPEPGPMTFFHVLPAFFHEKRRIELGVFSQEYFYRLYSKGIKSMAELADAEKLRAAQIIEDPRGVVHDLVSKFQSCQIIPQFLGQMIYDIRKGANLARSLTAQERYSDALYFSRCALDNALLAKNGVSREIPCHKPAYIYRSLKDNERRMQYERIVGIGREDEGTRPNFDLILDETADLIAEVFDQTGVAPQLLTEHHH
ncbi:MAG: hypothetical protein KAT70_03240 [Thermoplasmata archaeon]|nr:hypothetical protein [Thermoplasmata archaeon]